MTSRSGSWLVFTRSFVYIGGGSKNEIFAGSASDAGGG